MISNRTDQIQLGNVDTIGLGNLVDLPDVMLSPPHKEKNPDPDAPHTGLSVLSGISSLNSEDLNEFGLACSPPRTSSFAASLSMEEEGQKCRGSPGGGCTFPPLYGDHDFVDDSGNDSGTFSPTTTGLVGTLQHQQLTTTGLGIMNPPGHPIPSAWTNGVQVSMPVFEAVDTLAAMPVAEAVELLAAPQGSKRITSEKEVHPYQVVDGMIVLTNPEIVTAPMRIKIFTNTFGNTKADGEPWTRDDIAFKFSDMVGHGKTCLVHGLAIKSGSNWHCKGADMPVCAPCKVLKALKQIGTNMHKFLEGVHLEHQGGIPRIILDIATYLNLNSVDYRDLKLIFQALTFLGRDMTSCDTLWAACLQNADGKYLIANKRFYGCFMDPQVGHRPRSDNSKHSSSKGLANLWHESKIWKGGKYLTFTQKTRYKKTAGKIKERFAYEKYVIDASTRHLNEFCTNWIQLAHASWQELQLARDFLCKKVSDKKRKTKDEEYE